MSQRKNHLPQTPEQEKSDGLDVEFSPELADRDDKEAMERSEAADLRAHKRQ